MFIAAILRTAATLTFTGPFGSGDLYEQDGIIVFDTTNGCWAIDTRERGGKAHIVALCERYARRYFGYWAGEQGLDAAAAEFDAMMMDSEIGALSAAYGC